MPVWPGPDGGSVILRVVKPVHVVVVVTKRPAGASSSTITVPVWPWPRGGCVNVIGAVPVPVRVIVVYRPKPSTSAVSLVLVKVMVSSGMTTNTLLVPLGSLGATVVVKGAVTGATLVTVN